MVHGPIPFPGSKASLEELMEGGGATALSVYDEAALCSSTFKSVTAVVLRSLVETLLEVS